MLPCPKCQGKGKVVDQAEIGARFKLLRKNNNKTLREVSDVMKKSIGYISDLEHGRRAWNPDLEKRYRDAVGGE